MNLPFQTYLSRNSESPPPIYPKEILGKTHKNDCGRMVAGKWGQSDPHGGACSGLEHRYGKRAQEWGVVTGNRALGRGGIRRLRTGKALAYFLTWECSGDTCL